MAKVLLINPMFNFNSKRNPWIPIGLITLATVVNQQGHEGKILDRDIEKSDEKLINILRNFNPDIVGLQSYIGQTLLDLMKVCEIVKNNSNAIVVVGGVMATVKPEPFYECRNMDYIVRGEGELVLLEMCELIDKNKKNFSKLQNVNDNPMRPFINLNDFPLPDYSLTDIKKYPLVSFITSRGCPGKCTFCYNDFYYGKLQKKCLRMYNTENTIKMITNVIEKYKIKDFIIVDDNFANKSQRSFEVLNALEKYNVLFQCELRVDNAYDEVIQSLKKAGCWSILFGIESGSQRVLDFIQKETTVQQNADAIIKCRKFGVYSDASCMLGLPKETVEEMMLTVNFLKKYKPDSITANKFTPYPGTNIFEYCLKENLIKEPKTIEEYSNFEINNSKLNVSEIPTDKLLETINMLQKKSMITDLKKSLRTLKTGHYNHFFIKVMNRFKR